MRSKVLKKATGYLLTAVMVMMLCMNFFTMQVSAASDGFKVNGTKLYDANGNEFLMRGVNYPHAWYTSEYKTAIPAIADKGFNCVRLVMANGQKWGKTSYSEMSEMIELCKQNKLVAIVEIHDATGSDSTSDLDKAVEYWIEMKSLLQENEKYVIVNIANEWYGTWDDGSAWKNGYVSAIKKMRNAGIKNTIMVDCAGWGQYPQVIFDHGQAVLNADPDKNTMFSIHMYEYAGGDDTTVRNNIDNVVNKNLCLTIGEFGGYHTNGDVAEQTIMDYSQQKNVGWLAWSWTGNSGDLSFLDVCTDFSGKSLTDFGNTVINGTNGINQTAKTCSVFTGSTGGNTDNNTNNDGVYTDKNGGVIGLDGTYYIKSVHSGKYLDVTGGKSANGTNIEQWGFNGTDAQKFKLVGDGNGYYGILTACSDYKSGLDVYKWSTANGANIQQWEYHGGNCQKFQLVKIGDAYAIKTKVSDCYSCLDVYNWSTANGGNIAQYEYWGGNCQLWYLEPCSSSDSSNNTNNSNTSSNNNSSKTNIFYGSSYADNWAQAVSVSTTKNGGSADVQNMGSGDYIWVEYTGAYGDYDLVFQSNSGGNTWAKISPSENGGTDNGTYYSKFYYNDIVNVYGSDFSTVDKVHISSHVNGITVKSVDIVK